MALSYQIIEIPIDADDNETARIPSWRFDTLEQAVNRIENVLSRCKHHGFEAAKNYWWCTAVNGQRMRFMIEAV